MKKTLTILLIAGSLILVLVIIIDRPEPLSVALNGDETLNLNSDTRPLSVASDRSNQPALQVQTLPAPEDNNRNITRDLADNLIKTVAAASVNKNTASEKEIANQALISSSGLRIVDFIPLVDTARFTIIKNATEEQYNQYYSQVTDIIKKYIETSPQVQLRQLSPTALSSFRESLREIINTLYALPVPDDLVVFHEEHIRLLGIQEKVFSNLIAWDTDPVKAEASLRVFYEARRQLDNAWKYLSQKIAGSL